MQKVEESRKIVVFTPSLDIGGIEKVLLTYADILSTRKYGVVYLVCHENGMLFSEVPHGIKLHNLRTNDLKKSLFKIVSFFNQYRPDSVICANKATIVILLSRLLCRSKFKIITSHHNYLNSDNLSIIDKKLIWYVYNLCDSVIAVSSGIYKLLVNHHVKRRKVHLIYNPVNYEYIQRKSKEPIGNIKFKDYVVFVGRLTMVKNIPFLFKAFEICLNSRPNIGLLIVGDGPEKHNLLSLSEGIKNNILFLGAQENPYPYIKFANVVALPSLSEAFPTILLEALALGKTIVSTPTAGAVEILRHGDLGYITHNFTDTQQLAELILRAFDNPLDSAILRNAVGQYSFSETFRRLKNLL